MERLEVGHPPSEIPRIGLIGIPTDAGAGRRGARMGPAALRVAGIAERLSDLDYTVEDRGDVSSGHSDHDCGETMRLARRVSDTAYDCARSGSRPIFLGGDHSLSMGSVAGLARHWREQGRPLFVLWLDAHADFNTPPISPSGNLHGMALALLCGEPEFADVVNDRWHVALDPCNVTIFGARSIDREERNLLDARGVDVVDMRVIDEIGVAAPLRGLFERVERAHGVLHVSLDVDVLDPTLAPGVGTTVPGGLTFREAHLVMEMLHDCGLVRSLDLVELNPFLDHAGRSADLLVDLAASLFGRRILERRSGRSGPTLADIAAC